MSCKKKILVFCGYYLPGFKAGGPIRTIANMVHLLSDDFDFYIVTSDRDSLDKQPYPNLGDSNKWHEVGKAKVLYLSPNNRSFKKVAQIIKQTPHDALYLNSYFNYNFSIKPLILRRLGLLSDKMTVLAPRGEFSEGAITLKKSKKKIFRAVSNSLGLHSRVRWHVSSEYEKTDVLREVKSAKNEDVIIAFNLPDMSSLAKSLNFYPRHPDEPLRVVFLSRISPKKNLDYAINVLARVGVEIYFHFYGTVSDDEYNKKCFDLLDSAPSNLQYEYKGVLENHKVVETLSEYDLFILPTKGENYGHVILESLSAGTPALISDATPWRKLEANDSGWSISLDDPSAFVEKIKFMATLTPEQQLEKRANTLEYARSCLLDKEGIEDNKRIFKG